MKEKLQKIREHAMAEIENSDGLAKLNDVRVSILGKKGELTAVLKGMKDVAPEDRPKVGQWVNETREAIEAKLEETKKKLEAAELEHRLEHEVIDVTLPAKKNRVGHTHPNTMVLEEVERIFTGMGYEVVEGPEVEYDYYNFEALNIPVKMSIGTNKIDVTIFAGPDPDCAECLENGGCAFVNRTYYVQFSKGDRTAGKIQGNACFMLKLFKNFQNIVTAFAVFNILGKSVIKIGK